MHCDTMATAQHDVIARPDFGCEVHSHTPGRKRHQYSSMSNDSSPGGSQTSLLGPGLASDSEVMSLPNLKVLETNDQIRELQTTIRDKWVSSSQADELDMWFQHAGIHQEVISFSIPTDWYDNNKLLWYKMNNYADSSCGRRRVKLLAIFQERSDHTNW